MTETASALSEADQAAVLALIKRQGHGAREAFDISSTALANAAAGLPIKGATIRRIKAGLAKLRAPVCPRCLGIKPGEPSDNGGIPPEGPFTPDLCGPCKKAVVPCAHSNRYPDGHGGEICKDCGCAL